jgi:pimeloyl-ACP methyl ester carboxylesterase
MGGYVAWEFWRHHRERLSRLILCGTRASGDSEEVARARKMMAVRVIEAGANIAAESMMPKLFSPTTYDQQAELVDSVRQMILATAPQAIAATQRGMAERLDMSPQLHEIATPALVLCGADDTISPADEMSQIAQSMPNATYVEIAAAGHLAPLEQPAETNAAIRDFLANS